MIGDDSQCLNDGDIQRSAILASWLAISPVAIADALALEQSMKHMAAGHNHVAKNR